MARINHNRAAFKDVISSPCFRQAKDQTPVLCQLCRQIPKQGTMAHHLIPRTCHSNRWFRRKSSRDEMRKTIPLCRDCHHEIHRQIPQEKRLGREYNTVEKLRQHPMIARFLLYIQKRK